MKLSNYSLNYARPIARGEMDVFGFLALCHEMGLEGASLHARDLPSLRPPELVKVRRAYLDLGLSVAMFTVSTDFGRDGHEEAELARAREAIAAAAFLGAPLLRVFAGSPPDEAGRARAFSRAASSVRKVCEEAARVGLPIGLPNH